jgi:hypothetical protein
MARLVILRDLLDEIADVQKPEDKLDVDALISESLYGSPMSATVLSVDLPEQRDEQAVDDARFDEAAAGR